MIFNINAQIISYTISLQLKIIIKNSMSSEDKLTSYAPGYPGLPHGSPWDFSLTGCHLRKKSGDRCRNGWRPWLQFVHRSFTIDSMDCCWKICRKPMDFAAEFPMDVWISHGIFPWILKPIHWLTAMSQGQHLNLGHSAFATAKLRYAARLWCITIPSYDITIWGYNKSW